MYLLKKILEQAGKLPDAVVACVRGGGTAIGMFHPFMKDAEAGRVKLVGVEAGGRGTDGSASAATLTHGSPGVLHGTYSYLLQVSNGVAQPVPHGSVAVFVQDDLLPPQPS